MTNCVQTPRDFDIAAHAIVQRGWPLHKWNNLKNWDSVWLDTVMRDGDFLDIGCLTSMPLVIANHLKLKGRMVGMDIKIPMSEVFEPWELFAGRAENLPFPDESFDNVTCLSVIEHDVDLLAFTKELGRVLRKGGRFVITFDWWPEPTGTDLDSAALKLLSDSLKNNGLWVEPYMFDPKDKVIENRCTFACLRGGK